jgi:hypothetical protein
MDLTQWIAIGISHGLRNELHFSTKYLQLTLRCIYLSGKAAPSHYCHQMSGVNNPAGEADSCKTVISLRNPWVAHRVGIVVFMTTKSRSVIMLRRPCSVGSREPKP